MEIQTGDVPGQACAYEGARRNNFSATELERVANQAVIKPNQAGQDKNQKDNVRFSFPLLHPERQWQSVSNQMKKF
jgi:hypothetical protein